MIEAKEFEKIDLLSKYQRVIDSVKTVRFTGRVFRVLGMSIESNGPDVGIGDICRIKMAERKYLYCEVVAFRDEKVVLMPYGDITGITPGAMVSTTGQPLHIAVGDALLGRVVDGLGNPIDGKGQIFTDNEYPVERSGSNPLKRDIISSQLATGVRAIDGLLSVGKGQRIGIFSGSGVGKSTLMGMIARHTNADINVIALVGERGREVRPFLEKELGTDGLKKSVVVVATGDQAAMVRMRSAHVAMTIAEFFRDQGRNVNLIMDSVTRFAHAMREIGQAAGEPSIRLGYTPSVYSQLPRLLERAGQSDKGSITGFFTVLVDADDLNEPISDAARGILDGHIVLSRRIAERNHYPAIDVLGSVSRVMNDVISKEQKQHANRLKRLMSIYRDKEDMILMNAYQRGSNREVDEAIDFFEPIQTFLQQDIDEKSTLEETQHRLAQMMQPEQVQEKEESALSLLI